MEQPKNIEWFRLQPIVKAVEEVTINFDLRDALRDSLELLRDFSGCIDNIQKDCYVTEGKQPEDGLQELKEMYNTNRLTDLGWNTSHGERV